MNDLGSPEFPSAKDDDDDDVAWALSTAQVQWKRGSRADAVVWLRRAIESAVAVDATWRAAELTRQTDALEADLTRGPSAAPIPGDLPRENFDDFDGTDPIEVATLPEAAAPTDAGQPAPWDVPAFEAQIAEDNIAEREQVAVA